VGTSEDPGIGMGDGNLLCNGDFQGGNFGFRSDLPRATDARPFFVYTSYPFAYMVNSCFNYGCAVADHTTGNGCAFFIGNDDSGVNYRTVWEYTFSTLYVDPANVYRFQAYTTSICGLQGGAPPLLSFQISFNNSAWQPLGSSVDMTFATLGKNCPEWLKSSADYSPPGFGVVRIRLTNAQTASAGNDLALDDGSFEGVGRAEGFVEKRGEVLARRGFQSCGHMFS
jgi:hypothetical protein